jgi:hypothetical protein
MTSAGAHTAFQQIVLWRWAAYNSSRPELRRVWSANDGFAPRQLIAMRALATIGLSAQNRCGFLI